MVKTLKSWTKRLHPRVQAFGCAGSWWVQLDRTPMGGWSMSGYSDSEKRAKRAAKKLSILCAGAEAKRG